MPPIGQDDLDRLRATPEGAGLTPDAAFGVLYLEHEFGLSREDALQRVSPAPAPHGIDGFHVDEGLRNAWLFVFRWTDARTVFQAPLQQLADSGLAAAAGADAPGLAPDQFLLRLRGRWLAAQGVVDRVFVHPVFHGEAAALERSLAYGRLREDLENRKHLLDAFFGRPVTLAFEFRSAADGGVAGQAHRRVTQVHPVTLARPLTRLGPRGETLRIGFVRLTEMQAMFEAMGTRFFESNIRSILAEDTPTNRSLQRAFERVLLTGETDPLSVAFDHNGVTLSAERADEQAGVLRLTEPRLLNGAQTVATFAAFMAAHAGDPRLAARSDALAELCVLTKIITDAGAEFVQRVTLNNNRQNPVKPWNLHANDLIQLELQDKFREELGVYYERQERAFAALEEDDEEDVAVPAADRRALELVKLARTYLVADGDLAQLGRLTEVFERDDLYATVFAPRRLATDARHVVLCYKIQFRLARVLREIQERGEHKYAWIGRARNAVWALLAQGLLNDPGLADHAAAWGTRLTPEPGFTDHLASLASTRVRPLLGGVVEERHAAEIAGGKFGFLKTNALLDACLVKAKDRFGWTRRSL